jgi:hypothetical protein
VATVQIGQNRPLLNQNPATRGQNRPVPCCERRPSNARSQSTFNEHIEHEDGATVFAHACKLGLEGIVSKRKDSVYRSGRSPDWLKMKNPAQPAVKRGGEEEDWAR